jgi:protein-disulfide isomerase
MSNKVTAKQRRESRARQQRIIWLVVFGILGVGVLIFAVMQASRPPAVDATQLAALASGKTLGNASATVVVQEFADFQCPVCKQFQSKIEPQLVTDYVQTGKIRFEYHHYIVIDGNVGGTESRRAAQASECANAQGKFWPFHDILFSNQGSEGSGVFADDNLEGFAKTVGLDTTAFSQCFSNQQYASVVTKDEAKATSLGVHGTPSLFVNGVQVPNPFDYASFKTQIDAALAQAG